jgi:hypothetical protein
MQVVAVCLHRILGKSLLDNEIMEELIQHL